MKPPKRQRKAVEGQVYKGPTSYRRSTLSTKWSLKDKKKLLTALKRVHSHDDYTIIKKYVKNKTVEEIEQYVTQMKKKAEALAGRSRERDKQAERTPIETWLDTCRDLMREVPVECTQTFSQVLTVAAAEPANLEEPDDSPDYPAIYNYLSCLLRNATPPTLAPLDSAVVLDLLQSLADRLKTTDLSQLKEWLQMRYHDLKKSYVPDRPWQNPFNLTPEDLSLCDPQSSSQNKTGDSSEQTSNKQQTVTTTSPGHNTEAATTAEALDSKSASENTTKGPSTSTVEPSSSTVEPSTSTAETSMSTVGPSTSTGGPSMSTGGPSTSTGGPSMSTGGPSMSTGGPSMSTGGPSTSTGGPSTSTGGPSMSTGGPSTSTGGPSMSTGGPSTSTGGPSMSTGGPSTSTGGPSMSTGGPSMSTGGPSTSTGGPSMSTGGPSTSTAEPSTSTVEPSTSGASNKTQGDGKKQSSDERGTKEAKEIMCLNPLRIPARYLELEKLDFDSEGSESEEEEN